MLTPPLLFLQGIAQAARYVYRRLVNDGILSQAFSIAPVRSLILFSVPVTFCLFFWASTPSALCPLGVSARSGGTQPRSWSCSPVSHHASKGLPTSPRLCLLPAQGAPEVRLHSSAGQVKSLLFYLYNFIFSPSQKFVLKHCVVWRCGPAGSSPCIHLAWGSPCLSSQHQRSCSGRITGLRFSLAT